MLGKAFASRVVAAPPATHRSHTYRHLTYSSLPRTREPSAPAHQQTDHAPSAPRFFFFFCFPPEPPPYPEGLAGRRPGSVSAGRRRPDEDLATRVARGEARAATYEL